MANKVLLKKSSVASKVPLTTDLSYGELALNYTDEKLYFKNASNAIKSFNITQSSLTIGNGLSGTSYNGSSAVTIAIDSTVSTLTGIQTLTNKTLTSPTINTGTISGGTLNNCIIGGTTPADITGSSVTSTGNLVSSYSSGDEGGEILLTKPQTNSSIGGSGVRIDVYQNKLRIWEDGGTNRGVYIDLTSATAGVGSNLLSSAGTGTVTSVSVVSANGFAGTVATSTTTPAITLTTSITGLLKGNGTAISAAAAGTDYASPSQTMYIGTTSVAINRSSANLALTGISSVTLPGSTSGTVQLIPTAAVGTGTILTIPATTGTIVTTGDTGTVTNTMLAGSIAITKLAANTISGVSLGNNLNALTIGTGLSGTSYNGSAGVTIAIDTATTVDKTTAQTLTNKSLSDSTTYFIDETDATKKLQFQLSSITTATTRTLTVPDINGTIITTGDTGTITSTMIAEGTIVNGDISASAAIAITKLASSTISGVSLGSNLNALTISAPLSGTSYNGSSAISIGLSAAYGDTTNPYASKTANYFLAAPNGSAGVPTFRAIVAADIPTLNQNTTGTATTATNVAGGVAGSVPYQTAAGTTAMTAASTVAGQVLTTVTAGGAPTWVTPSSGSAFTNLSYTGTLTGSTGILNIGSGQLYKDASGNVGIGTSSPSAKLDVVGGIKMSGQLMTGASGSVYSPIVSAGYVSGTSNLYLRNLSGTNRIDSYNDPITATYPLAINASVMSFNIADSEKMRIDSSGNVGIGTASPSYKLQVAGSFAATTKSFVIDHPTKEGMKLRYGSLEGPENGIYIRGRLNGNNIIELPEYWTKLIDEDSITVNLTPIGKHQKLYVSDIIDNTVIIGNDNLLQKEINCFYTVFAERIDVEKLIVEIE